jgi:hypothetical protein
MFIKCFMVATFILLTKWIVQEITSTTGVDFLFVLNTNKNPSQSVTFIS